MLTVTVRRAVDQGVIMGQDDVDRTMQAIDRVDARLAALQEAGHEVGGLVAQLACARELVASGEPNRAAALCEDLLTLATAVANGDQSEESAAHDAVGAARRYWQDEQIGDQVREAVAAALDRHTPPPTLDVAALADALGERIGAGFAAIAERLPLTSAAAAPNDALADRLERALTKGFESIAHKLASGLDDLRGDLAEDRSRIVRAVRGIEGRVDGARDAVIHAATQRGGTRIVMNNKGHASRRDSSALEPVVPQAGDADDDESVVVLAETRWYEQIDQDPVVDDSAQAVPTPESELVDDTGEPDRIAGGDDGDVSEHAVLPPTGATMRHVPPEPETGATMRHVPPEPETSATMRHVPPEPETSLTLRQERLPEEGGSDDATPASGLPAIAGDAETIDAGDAPIDEAAEVMAASTTDDGSHEDAPVDDDAPTMLDLDAEDSSPAREGPAGAATGAEALAREATGEGTGTKALRSLIDDYGVGDAAAEADDDVVVEDSGSRIDAIDAMLAELGDGIGPDDPTESGLPATGAEPAPAEADAPGSSAIYEAARSDQMDTGPLDSRLAEVSALDEDHPPSATGSLVDRDALRETLLDMLPELLQEEAVRQKLFAVLALEAATTPSALGELTGIREFLRKELHRVAEDEAQSRSY